MKSRFGIVFVLVVPVICGSALASTINVPTDQPTIQDGINAAVNGDTVLVAPGDLPENVNFNGKAIGLRVQVGRRYVLLTEEAWGRWLRFRAARRMVRCSVDSPFSMGTIAACI